MSPQELLCAVILQAACEAELGLVVRTNNPVKARAALYAARKNLGSAALAPLTIRVSPDDPSGAIWIIRTDVSRSWDLAPQEEVMP